MLRKDLRSMVLSLCIGDGCLFYHKRGAKRYGGFSVEHGIKQKDYLQWKADLLSKITGRKVKCRVSKNGNAIQLSVCMKRFAAWRKWLYPNGKKDISRILKYIDNPEFCLAVWLMDDGYVEPSISKLADGSKKLYGARFRIFSCETPVEKQPELIKWLEDNLGITAKVHFMKRNYKDENDPFLKINQQDSLKIWEKIREFVLQFDSMKYKFRHIEEIYQKRMSKCSTSNS
jgi:hypothetical protein